LGYCENKAFEEIKKEAKSQETDRLPQPIGTYSEQETRVNSQEYDKTLMKVTTFSTRGFWGYCENKAF
jgi:hypothetical protein